MSAISWVIAVLALALIGGAIAVVLRWLGPDRRPSRTPEQSLDDASVQLRDGSSGWISRR